MFVQRLEKIFYSLVLRQIWHFILAASSGGLVVWATIELFQHPCPVAFNYANLVQKCSQIPWDLIPIFIGFVFWIIGLAGLFYKWKSVGLEFFFISCSMLVTGFVSGLGIDLGIRLFYVFLGLLAPLIIQFHGYWLKSQPNKFGRVIYDLVLFLSLISITPFVIWQNHTLELFGIAQALKNFIRLIVLLSAASTVLMIFKIYQKDTTFLSRSRVRLVFFGIIFAIAPLIFLNILPRLVSGQFIPAEYTIFWLLIIPLSYGYSILRPTIAKSESIVFHVILYFLLAILVLSVSLFVSTIVIQFNKWNQAWLFFGLLFTVFGVWVYSPVRRGLSRFVMWVLYGGENHYINVLEQISLTLIQVIERGSLGELLITKLMQAMPLSGAALLLVNSFNDLTVQTSMNLTIPTFLLAEHTDSSEDFNFFIRKRYPIEQGELLNSSWFKNFKKDGQNQIVDSGIALWIPLVSNNRLFGLLLLGHKLNDDFFTVEDRRVIGILAHQAGIAAYNILLVEDISEGRKELAKANQRLLTAQDKEKARLARDLHDVVIQQLIGLSYKFSETRKKLSGESKGEDVRQEVQDDLKSFQEGLIETVSKLRSVMRDLRPVGLDDLGLTEAFEAELTRLQREIDPKGPKIEWDLERTDEPISYLVKINLFRIAQEAVKNAIAHAEAKSIKVVLRFYDDTGTLEIIDDGIGFNVPGRLSQFAQTNHYGLLGIYERASSIDGQLIVESQSNRGTMVSIHFQL